MSELLLVPIHVDALYVAEGGTNLIAPLADFSQIPYTTWVKHFDPPRPTEIIWVPFNTDSPFTSQSIMRKPADLAVINSSSYVTENPGMHLHWSLPDALTVMRADPNSDNRLRFPQVPNRWLITSKTKANNAWQIAGQWVVESDYLHYEDATRHGGVFARDAITFPIVSFDQYRTVLTNPAPASTPTAPADPNHPAPSPYNAVYAAPFRYMGRAQSLADWKSNSDHTDYLYKFMPDGLTAAGYGDPLFAAIYTNCSSVFGFFDNGADNSQTRRYDILGWYENTTDCLDLFAALAKQKPHRNLYDALVSEYKWKVTNPPAAFPTLSLYYASVDVEAQLKPNPLLAKVAKDPAGPQGYQLAVAVGNTATEALSADLAQTLAEGNLTDRVMIEDQLEAIGLRHDLGDSPVDLDARFREARHSKGFQPRSGGTLWSIQLRNTDKTVGQSSSPPPAKQGIIVPTDLANVLNDLNLVQAEYDAAWQEIETLRQRVFADWYKFDSAYNIGTANTTVIYTNAGDVPKDQHHSDPNLDPTWENLKKGHIHPTDFVGDQDEILPYIRAGSLEGLQQRIAAAGLVSIGKDAGGNVTFSATNASDNRYVANQYTLAQGVILRLNALSSLVNQHNAGPKMQTAQQEFFVLRKSAPRFWQPNEPAVLLKGAAVPSTLRHGEDGRANDDDTLSCHVLTVSPTLADISSQLRTGDPNKVVQSIQTTIESLRPQTVTPNTIGFSQQTEEPWHPISLEWEVSVWPETPGMDSQLNDAQAGKDYQSGFVGANYEFDENASELRLAHPPSRFNAGETENIYTGRTTLTPGAAQQLSFNLAEYLMALTLSDLKSAITNRFSLSNELDGQVDKSLIEWAKLHFTLTDVPAQQTAFTDWSRTQHIFRVADTTKGPQGQPITKYRLVDLTDPKHFPAGWYNGKPALTGSPSAPTLTTFGALTKVQQLQDPLNTALRAYETLRTTNVLAQSLGGFNNALLMRQQIPQLPVFDVNAMIAAIGTEDSSDEKYKDLTRDVAAAVAGGNTSSPITFTDFLPIRSGLMQVNKLYLVDTFGQVRDVSPARILPSHSLTISRNVTNAVKITPDEDALYTYLAPRITQPARLNFRWLAATPGKFDSVGEPEMNDHPATSPVCGWLIPNHLDNSLMFCDAEGIALGSVQLTGEWEPAPGTVNRVRADAIPNSHLRQLANYLTGFSQKNTGYWDAFLKALDFALENIEPTNYAQHDALALLIGRPIAVVRASLSLQLQGKPALNQQWRALLSDMYEGMLDSRVNNNFTNVNFPVRLGEHKQFNDGLVGYWIEDEKGEYQDDKFYSSQAEDVNNRNIITHRATAITQNLTLTTTPLKLTMLIDPRGEVHATSAILPSKQISLPPDQYAGILRKLSVTFMTAPVLTDAAGIRLNLPKESGYSWSWLARPSPSVWQQLDQIHVADNTLRFAPQRLVGGWLKLTPEDPKS